MINLKSQAPKAKLSEIILLTLFGVLMYVSQVIMASLPNIEIVSLLIIIVTRRFGFKALYSVYVFVFCEILTYGIHIWVINYLYVWAILCFAVIALRSIDSAALYTLIASLFGLCFGTLCSVPYFFIGGFSMGIGYIMSGIAFDLMHFGGNAVSVALLYRPLTKVMNKLIKS